MGLGQGSEPDVGAALTGGVGAAGGAAAGLPSGAGEPQNPFAQQAMQGMKGISGVKAPQAPKAEFVEPQLGSAPSVRGTASINSGLNPFLQAAFPSAQRKPTAYELPSTLGQGTTREIEMADLLPDEEPLDFGGGKLLHLNRG